MMVNLGAAVNVIHGIRTHHDGMDEGRPMSNVDDTTTGIATIEGIDFSADVACDAQNDGGCEYNNPAEYITAGTCPHCGNLQRFPTCGPCKWLHRPRSLESKMPI